MSGLWLEGCFLLSHSGFVAMLGFFILLLLGAVGLGSLFVRRVCVRHMSMVGYTVGMASQLTNLGVVQRMSNYVAKVLQSFSLGWPATFGILPASYFLTHYLFASQIGHEGALFSAFLVMCLVSVLRSSTGSAVTAATIDVIWNMSNYSYDYGMVYPVIFAKGGCFSKKCWIWSLGSDTNLSRPEFRLLPELGCDGRL